MVLQGSSVKAMLTITQTSKETKGHSKYSAPYSASRLVGMQCNQSVPYFVYEIGVAIVLRLQADVKIESVITNEHSEQCLACRHPIHVSCCSCHQ